ncbi:MAG: ATP-binding cassette domain-containing protein [Alphaproteobacteria bacterium]|nr:ATP-binding cassette domain-containing protein [Alphaproteobacteria bacterium]
MQPVLNLDKVSIEYSGVPAVKEVSWLVQPGETCGLIGLNGAGKTTLIKSILGLRQSKTGNLAVFGSSDRGTALKSRISYLPEKFEPPWFLTGLEFIVFTLRLYKRKVDIQEVETLSRQLALDPAVLKRRVQTYSKGMRQKLGLIATIVSGCDLLILDEPMSGLDPQARRLVKDTILSHKGQKTVLLSSHILSDMDEICDKVVIIHKGRLLFQGTPEALKTQTGAEILEKAFISIIDQDDQNGHNASVG